MTLARLRRWWPAAKILLAAAILAAVGWQFWRDVHHEGLHALSFDPAWLVASALLYVIDPPVLLADTWNPALLGLILLAVCGVPLLPGVFNRIVGRLARRFENVESFRLPRLGVGTLLEGLVTTSGVWVLFGLSL